MHCTNMCQLKCRHFANDSALIALIAGKRMNTNDGSIGTDVIANTITKARHLSYIYHEEISCGSVCDRLA